MLNDPKLITPRHRGGERNWFNESGVEEGKLVDITELFEKDYNRSLVSWQGAAGVEFDISSATEYPAFFCPLDRKVPKGLFKDVVNLIRYDKLSPELLYLIEEVLDVQKENLMRRMEQANPSKVTFYPADSLHVLGECGKTVYVFLCKMDGDFYVQTESFFSFS